MLPGDGIGPEIMSVALKVLDAAGAKEGEQFQYTEVSARLTRQLDVKLRIWYTLLS